LLDSFNLQPVLVDVGRVDTERWHQQRAGLIENYKNHTDRYFFCTAFTATDIDQPDYAQRVIEHIKHDLEQGASMVKVWKNFGMISKGDSGAYVQIDDPRIQPVWDFLVAQDIPVLAHIGEPLQAWRPLDDDNPHAGYFREHPEYHAYQHPEIPSWETIQQARNNWLKNNPDLIVVGAHHGSMSHDVGLIGETLDKYPNFNVEPAARFADLALQNSDSVRNYYVKYQDRILYGTDYGTSGDEQDMTEVEKVGEKKRLAQRMDAHWKYLSTFDTVEILVDPPIPTRGLGLPDSVLRKVYYLNAIRILKIDN
jgi:predicted TIM-barrel fold metal-dependent hydrolase